MLGIYIGGEPLEIVPGTSLEIEQETPYLQFGDEIKGEFSLPFEVGANPQNLRLLDWAGLLQKRVIKTGTDCQVFDNGLQHSIGKIRVEKPQINRSNTGLGKISCFYLSGVASFYQDIKDILMTEVDLGGARVFPQPSGTLDITNASTFWGHIHQVLHAEPGTYDYAFFPVSNHSWTGDETATDEMNRLRVKDGIVQFDPLTSDRKDGNVIVPFPYLHYVLKQAVKHVGWTIEGDIFNDPDFLKITMINFFCIDWNGCFPFVVEVTQRPITRNNVTINLQDCMPRKTIAEFLVALKNRFGWWYDFDKKNKVIRVQPLQRQVGSATKDFTMQASTVITKTVTADPKVYSLKNEFVSDDGNGKAQLDVVDYQGEVADQSVLPAVGDSVVGQVYLVRQDNIYFMCRQTGASSYEWQRYAQHIHDVVPAGATDEITTKATTAAQEWVALYGHYQPRIDLQGVWIGRNDCSAEWSFHLVFYHGWQMTQTGRQFPLASHHVYNAMGTQVGDWSLAFEAKLKDGTPVGLYDLQWKTLLGSISQAEKFDFTLNLSLPEFLKLQFSDIILVSGVKMFLTKMKWTVPFSGSVIVEATRVV